MRIAIASDHGGFCQKAPMVEYLEGLGHTVVDLGPSTGDRCDYPDYGDKVARFVAAGKSDRGILICGTGIGMSIAANRHKGIRAALCTHEFQARATREHNNANVLCLAERVTGKGVAVEIAQIFLAEDFEGGRHARRVAMLDA